MISKVDIYLISIYFIYKADMGRLLLTYLIHTSLNLQLLSCPVFSLDLFSLLPFCDVSFSCLDDQILLLSTSVKRSLSALSKLLVSSCVKWQQRNQCAVQHGAKINCSCEKKITLFFHGQLTYRLFPRLDIGLKSNIC